MTSGLIEDDGLRIEAKRRKMLDDAEKLARIGSFEWDIPNNEVTWSDGLYAIYGLAPGEFEASFEAFLAQLHPDDRDRVQATIEAAYGDATPFAMEERIVRRDGSVRVLRSRGEVVTDAGGAAMRILGVCQDITESKRAEELLENWNRALEERVRERTAKLEDTLEQLTAMQDFMVTQAKMASVGHLVAGITHEVNTPVGVIRGATDMVDRCADRISEALTRGADPGELIQVLRDSAQSARRAGSRLAEIIDRLEVLSELDESPLAQLAVNETLEAVASLVAHHAESRVRVRTSFGEIPTIWCYPGQLNHAFMSLLQNASEAVETNGEIRITTWAETGNVFVRIQDDGRGIAPEELHSLFELGFSTKGSRVQLGTGLFNANNIIRKHRGDIKVASELGRGASFTVRLPAGRFEPAADS